MSEEKKIENVRTTQHKVVVDSPSPIPYDLKSPGVLSGHLI